MLALVTASMMQPLLTMVGVMVMRVRVHVMGVRQVRCHCLIAHVHPGVLSVATHNTGLGCRRSNRMAYNMLPSCESLVARVQVRLCT